MSASRTRQPTTPIIQTKIHRRRRVALLRRTVCRQRPVPNLRRLRSQLRLRAIVSSVAGCVGGGERKHTVQYSIVPATLELVFLRPPFEEWADGGRVCRTCLPPTWTDGRRTREIGVSDRGIRNLHHLFRFHALRLSRRLNIGHVFEDAAAPSGTPSPR